MGRNVFLVLVIIRTVGRAARDTTNVIVALMVTYVAPSALNASLLLQDEHAFPAATAPAAAADRRRYTTTRRIEQKAQREKRASERDGQTYRPTGSRVSVRLMQTKCWL